MPARILVADDDPALLELMSMTLRKEGFTVETVRSAAELQKALGGSRHDLILSDIYLGDGTAIDLLDEMKASEPSTPVILVTAQGTVETVAAATAAGVFDYLAKPFRIDELVDRVRGALGVSGDGPAPLDTGPESTIIGNHPLIVEVYKAVGRVAPLPLPVLIHGETGTGKELVARALHQFGAHPHGPFVALNCGAIPETLLESELFGHRRGAFSGADRDHAGAIEEARDGTVFLDEVGELPPQLQVKLLRFLQDGEIRPLGSGSTIRVPVRVIAATHRDLRGDVDREEYRADFFYRLAAYEISLPALRQRTSDIPFLVEHFRKRFLEKTNGADLPGASRATLDLLEQHQWPGNVRELENVVQRALVDYGSLADPTQVSRLLHGGEETGAGKEKPPAIGDDLSLAEIERLHIETVLRRYSGNKSRAAKVLGIERKSLYRKAQRLGIDLSLEVESTASEQVPSGLRDIDTVED